MIELIVKKDDREINRYFLPQGITTLGRAEDNGIILDDSCVSRRHARIKVDGVRVQIEDLGSGNGTYYGEGRIEKQELGDGDEIVIEPFKLTLKKDKAEKQEDMGRTRPAPKASGPPSTRLDAPPPRQREPGGSAAGGVRLEVVRGSGGPYLLSDDEATIGRGDDAKITLRDPSSSRKHAAVVKTGKGWVLRDLDSANGTYVNGAAIKEMVLSDGDILLIGNTELRFVDPTSAALEVQQPVTPPPATRPVDNGRRGNKRAPPPPPEPVYEDAADGGMEMPGSYMDGGGGGAMPMDASTGGYGGTEIGPPPPAFGGGPPMEQTGEGDFGGNNNFDQGGYDDQGGNGGYGVELGDGALFPGGQRPPDSLLGKFIVSFKTNGRTRLITLGVGLIFVIILIGKGMGNKPSGGGGSHGWIHDCDTQCDGGQKLTMGTMKQYENEAASAIDASKPFDQRDWNQAFDRYQRIVKFSHNGEMANVLEAQVLGRRATDALYTMHEALVVHRLEDATVKGQQHDKSTQDRIDKDLRDGSAALERGKKTHRVADFDQAVKLMSDLLTIDPGNSEAKSKRDEAQGEANKIRHVVAIQNQAELESKCKDLYDRGVQQLNGRSAQAYQGAIKTFEQVIQTDPDTRTPYPGQANQQIAAAKRKLSDLARPLRDQAKAAENKQDWLRGRSALRQAIATNPYDPTLNAELDQVQTECIKNAKRQISEGKAYMAADNYPEAMKSLSLALQYADRDSDRENQQTKDLIKQIKRNTER